MVEVAYVVLLPEYTAPPPHCPKPGTGSFYLELEVCCFHVCFHTLHMCACLCACMCVLGCVSTHTYPCYFIFCTLCLSLNVS